MSATAILCVDDELMVLHSLRDQISRYFGDRCQCELAESAAEALEVIEELEQNNIKLLIIVSDWLMPNLRGDEFLIQVHQRFPESIKILLTGQAESAAIDRARQQANLFSHIPKPWDETTLIATLKSGLEAMYE
ncbi:MAG: response regulator [Chloroflexaceae bacterium]|nr:response regulator [Chloroflexaceae bacterium]